MAGSVTSAPVAAEETYPPDRAWLQLGFAATALGGTLLAVVVAYLLFAAPTGGTVIASTELVQFAAWAIGAGSLSGTVGWLAGSRHLARAERPPATAHARGG